MSQGRRETTGAEESQLTFHSLLRGLSPSSFALVMATGIVSSGLHQVGRDALSFLLLAVTAVSYVVLWVLFVWRWISHRVAMLHDMRDPAEAFGFFTVVAATDVLAVRVFQQGLIGTGVALVALACALWIIGGYVLLWQVFMTRDGQPILARTNGSWFLWAVASQSLAIGAAQAQPHLPGSSEWVAMLVVLAWSVGAALYVVIAILVLLRIIHYGITPQEFEPPYWVVMGALAIAVVAGTSIVDLTSSPMVDAVSSVVAGSIVVFWSFCVWLIPMLVGAGIWRHVVHRVSLRYTPALWSMVFPLGMFAVASISLGRADHLSAVEAIGHGMLVVAGVVWLAVVVAMLAAVFSTVARRAPRW